MTPRRLVNVALRFIVAYALLVTLFVYWDEALVAPLLPLFRWELTWLMPNFAIASLAVQTSGAERVLTLGVEVAGPVNLGGIWPPRAPFDSSTLLGHVFQPTALMMSVLIALPARDRALMAWRLAFGFVAAIPLAMLDVPWVLSGAIVDLMLASVPYPPAGVHPLVAMMNFLNGGGRLVLALVAAGLVAMAANAISTRARNKYPLEIPPGLS